MIDLQTVLTYLTLISVPVGVLYHIMTLRNTRKNQELTLKAQELATETRQAQLFMSIYQSMNTSEGLEAGLHIHDVKMKTAEDLNQLVNEEEKWKAWNWYGNYLEGIGVLVKENLVDISHVAQLISGTILWYWEEYREVTMAAREELDWPRYSIEVEYLYNRIVEYGKAHPELKLMSPSKLNP